MPKINLKEFQNIAVKELVSDFQHKLLKPEPQSIYFQSPTGSGKTIIMAEFVRQLINHPDLIDLNFAFLWASIGGSKEKDLAKQSKSKFEDYLKSNHEILISDLQSLARHKTLTRGEILFFNWSKIKAKNKEDRKLRQESEIGIPWDDMLVNTLEKDTKIILIIDEAHTNSTTVLAKEEINTINPQIVIKMTATHKTDVNIDVRISHQQVINSGLIVSDIKLQESSEFEKTDEDLDLKLLHSALKKRYELEELYKNANLLINPLLMIQLPNDDMVNKLDNKKDWVLRRLKEENIADNDIAIWLDKEKVNLDNIKDDDSNIDILLFKQAPATGWDCPRAKILLMYREIKDPIFQTQTLGRITRLPLSIQTKTANNLKFAHLYTNYTKNQILEGYKKNSSENKLKIYESCKKPDILPIELPTYPSQRISYNDLGKSFQGFFCEIATEKINLSVQNELKQIKTFVNIDIITNLNFADYDGFVKKLKLDLETRLNEKLSDLDIEKLYNKLCVQILKDTQTRFTNIARSWEPLKMALNVYFEKYLYKNHIPPVRKNEYYPQIVNDLSNPSTSLLIPVIHFTLKEYEIIRESEEKVKKERLKNMHTVLIPPNSRSFTDDYEEIVYEKSAMQPFYENKNKPGYKNEERFIQYLENHPQVQWWYKNGDSGSEFFSILKDNGGLFYPDFFIKTINWIWIIDTKGGLTAEGPDAQMKFKALRDWLLKDSNNRQFKGGLVKQIHNSNSWLIAKDKNLTNWSPLNLE